jgi:hypothetical protein
MLSAVQCTSTHCTIIFEMIHKNILNKIEDNLKMQAAYLVIENERFGLVFTKTGSINSGTDHLLTQDFRIHCKKRLVVFPSPARMSITELSLAGTRFRYRI